MPAKAKNPKAPREPGRRRKDERPVSGSRIAAIDIGSIFDRPFEELEAELEAMKRPDRLGDFTGADSDPVPPGAQKEERPAWRRKA